MILSPWTLCGLLCCKDKEKKGHCVEHIRNSSERCKYYNAQGGATMRLIDNVNTLLKDDLAQVLKKKTVRLRLLLPIFPFMPMMS